MDVDFGIELLAAEFKLAFSPSLANPAVIFDSEFLQKSARCLLRFIDLRECLDIVFLGLKERQNLDRRILGNGTATSSGLIVEYLFLDHSLSPLHPLK